MMENSIDVAAKERKKILVLMSTYNGEKYLEPQITSIMNQKVGADVYLRIRDDGSTDKTCQIIENLKSVYVDRIELLAGDNIGYNASFFELLKTASGYDFYAISDQDDVWLESKLQCGMNKILEIASDKPVLFASTSYLVEDDMIPYGTTRKINREFTIFNTSIQNICPGHNQIFNEELAILIRNQEIDVSKVYVYDSWIMNYAMLYGKIVFSNTPLTYYRQHKNNQLGSGAGKLGQLLSSKNRIQKGDDLKYKNQVAYFVELNRSELERVGAYDELLKYVSSKKLSSRIKYAFQSKLYRQSAVETIAFRIAVALGKF